MKNIINNALNINRGNQEQTTLKQTNTMVFDRDIGKSCS